MAKWSPPCRTPDYNGTNDNSVSGGILLSVWQVQRMKSKKQTKGGLHIGGVTRSTKNSIQGKSSFWTPHDNNSRWRAFYMGGEGCQAGLRHKYTYNTCYDVHDTVCRGLRFMNWIWPSYSLYTICTVISHLTEEGYWLRRADKSEGLGIFFPKFLIYD